MSKRYNINHNYLDTIDTREKAYFLGLFATDGWMRRGAEINIKLHKDDDYLLHMIQNDMEADRPIRYESNAAQMSLTSQNMFKALELVFAGVNKTQRICPAWTSIPYDLQPSFVLGLVDGDGSFTKCSGKPRIIFASVDKAWCFSVQKWFEDRDIKAKVYTEIRQGKMLSVPSSDTKTHTQMDMHRVVIQAQDEVAKTVELLWLKNRPSFCLTRKYSKAVQWLAEYKRDKKAPWYEAHDWEGIYNEYMSSGKFMKTVCAEHNVPQHQLQRWMKRNNKPGIPRGRPGLKRK